MASSINKHSHSAIYTIDPKINSFVLQGGKKDEFKESISIENGRLLNFVLKSKKFTRKIIKTYGTVYFLKILGKEVKVQL